MNDSTIDPVEPLDSRTHFIDSLAIGLEYADGAVRGRAALTPAMWGAGTRCPRLALLAAMVDVVAGHAPDGPRTPTVDLRIQRIGPLPEKGEIELVARADRVGRKLVVASTTLFDVSRRPFARATTTFMNQVMTATPFRRERPPTAEIDSFEDLVGARPVDATTVEVAPAPALSNGPMNTVQGGVQAFLAELAAERVAGPRSVALDLDIRFLNRVKVGPLHGRAHSVGRTGGLSSLRVELVDAGDRGRTVSTVSLLMGTEERADEDT